MMRLHGVMACVVLTATVQAQSLASAVSEARMSPHGTAVAFVRAVSDPSMQNLWLVDFAGSTPLKVTTPEGSLSHVRWSPDSELIAYLSRREPATATQLKIVAARGGLARTLSAPTADVQSFEFSLDGRHIRLQSGDAGSTPQTAVVETATGRSVVGNFAPVSASDPAAAAKLSPGLAAEVIFTSTAGKSYQSFVLSDGAATWLDVVNLSTGTRITVMRPGMATIMAAPTWSSDGNRFAVVAASPGEAAEVFVGSLTELSSRPDWVGATTPRVRQITFGTPQ